MQSVWYDIYLACKHPAKWNEFMPVPKVGDKKWCRICKSQIEIVEVERHTVHASDEEEVEYG